MPNRSENGFEGREFALTTTRRNDGVCLKLMGELDVATAGELRERLNEFAREGTHVQLDLSELAFIDSSGINVLLEALLESRRDGWNLTVEPELSRAVQRVIQIAGIGQYIWPRTP